MQVFDSRTSAWFKNHVGAQTTVCMCKKCGLYYKPLLGHKCKWDLGRSSNAGI